MPAPGRGLSYDAAVVDPAEALEVLLELTRTLARTSCLDEALKSVTDASLRLLPANHSSVRVLDERGKELLAAARSGVGLDHRPLSFRPGVGLAGWVVLHNELLRVDDTNLDPRFVHAGEQGFTIRSMLAVPLELADRVIGVLSLTSPRTGAFGPDSEDLARLIANCAVPAIERARLNRLAITDALTRAFNHRHLGPRLEEEMERARRHRSSLSVLLMDLDHFKVVNDTHGHAAGDVVLSAFADLVRAKVRRYNVLVRRGGEEFVLIIPSAGKAGALRLAERLRKSLAQQDIAVGEAIRIRQTVSIGVATWDGIEGAEALQARADAAMYHAKRAGRNAVVAWEREAQELPNAPSSAAVQHDQGGV